MRQTPHAGPKGGPAYGAVPGGDANGFSTTMMYDSMPMGSWAENPISSTLKTFFDVPSCKSTSHGRGLGFDLHAVSGLALSLSTDEKSPFNIIRAELLTGRSMVLGGRSAQGGAEQTVDGLPELRLKESRLDLRQ